MHNYTIGLVRYFGKNLYIYQINQVCLYEIIINLFVLFFCVNYQIKFLYIQNKNKLIWYIIFPKVDDKRPNIFKKVSKFLRFYCQIAGNSRSNAKILGKYSYYHLHRYLRFLCSVLLQKTLLL